MPTYNYYCTRCDLHFSCFQSMRELPKSNCEKCGGSIERIITGGTGLIFKGSGFYLTDYKDNDNMKNKESNPESKKDSKSDSKKSKIDKKTSEKSKIKENKSNEKN